MERMGRAVCKSTGERVRMGRTEVRASFHIREGPSEALLCVLYLSTSTYLFARVLFSPPPRARSCLRMPSILNLKFKVRFLQGLTMLASQLCAFKAYVLALTDRDPF